LCVSGPIPPSRRSKKNEHGIDFGEAQALWLDDYRLERPARSDVESRSIVVGRIQQTIWAALVTYREETIRLISVRPARRRERVSYQTPT